MKKLTAADTLTLSIPERIQFVGDVWDTVAVAAGSVRLTENEKKILDERLDAYHKNPELGSSWEDVLKRITRKK